MGSAILLPGQNVELCLAGLSKQESVGVTGSSGLPEVQGGDEGGIRTRPFPWDRAARAVVRGKI